MALRSLAFGVKLRDRERGRTIFQRPALSCGKCHATDEWGRQVVGPNLQGVGRRLPRLSLLEAIVAPNRPVSTVSPFSRSRPLNVSYSGSACSGLAAAVKLGRLPLRQSP